MKEELLEIVNERNKLLGLRKARGLVHRKLIHWHRVTMIWIVNDREEILCQLRSLEKDADPGKWQSFFGGHVRAGETYKRNAVEELREELGLVVRGGDLEPVYVRKSMRVRHFAQVYVLRWSGNPQDLRLDPSEVAGVKWFSVAALSNAIEAGGFCNRIDEEIARYLGYPWASDGRSEPRRNPVHVRVSKLTRRKPLCGSKGTGCTGSRQVAQRAA